MIKETDFGIYCFSDKQFYCYDAGPGSRGNSVERIRGTLLAKKLIKFDKAFGEEGSYEIITVGTAKKRELKTVILYPTQYRKEIAEKRMKEEQTNESSLWS